MRVMPDPQALGVGMEIAGNAGFVGAACPSGSCGWYLGYGRYLGPRSIGFFFCNIGLFSCNIEKCC